MQANDLRKGMVVKWNGDLCKVLEFHHHTPGNLRAMVQAKLRNLRTGNQFEHRFRSQDEVEQVEAKAPQHALSAPPERGQRLVVTFLMGQVTSARLLA